MFIIWIFIAVVGLIVVAVVLAVTSASRRRDESSSYTYYDQRYRPPSPYYQPDERRSGSRATALIITLVAIGLLGLGAVAAYMAMHHGSM